MGTWRRRVVSYGISPQCGQSVVHSCQLVARAFAFIWSNSAWVIVPSSSSFLAEAIWSALEPPPLLRRLPGCTRSAGRCISLLGLDAALRHSATARDQVDEHAQDRQHDDEQHQIVFATPPRSRLRKMSPKT